MTVGCAWAVRHQTRATASRCYMCTARALVCAVPRYDARDVGDISLPIVICVSFSAVDNRWCLCRDETEDIRGYVDEEIEGAKTSFQLVQLYSAAPYQLLCSCGTDEVHAWERAQASKV
eukprot:594077-Rhodomonas_salina.2